MNEREQGFLLLTSQLGDPERRPLSTAQLRTLAARARSMKLPAEQRDLRPEDLAAIGYSPEQAERILGLLNSHAQLEWYVRKGARRDCQPITRVSQAYPKLLRQRLGTDRPGCLWGKGDVSLLEKPAIALVGSRELKPENLAFAKEAGRQAALQGYVLVSGNARGADRAAQDACLEQGGQVISVVADELEKQPLRANVLYLSEGSFDAPFSSPRALSRNRIIHALARTVLVAQCTLGKGGTWSGTQKNLRNHWSPVGIFDDKSDACKELTLQGAFALQIEDLPNLEAFIQEQKTLFDQ